MRWIDDEKKTGQTFILVPPTPVTRKAISLSSTQCAAKFLGYINSGRFGCHQSRILCLGKKGFVASKNPTSAGCSDQISKVQRTQRFPHKHNPMPYKCLPW